MVVDDEKRLTDRLSGDAPAKGLRAEIVDSLSAARAAIAHQRPDVVLLSLSISSVVEENLQLVSELSRFTPPVPVLVRTAENSLANRLDVVRSGGGGFLPNANGIEPCRVVLNDPQWTGLPVLFLSSHTDAETVAQIFEAGADDYVSKPIVGQELVTRVRNRFERTRLQRSIAELDPLTGLSNRN